jgi:hypothetical protein
MSQAQEGTGPGSARQGARAGGQCAKDSATARGKKINLIIAVARAGEGQQIPRPSPMVPSWHTKKKKRAGSELGRGFEVKSPIGRRSSRDQSDRVKPRSLIVLRPIFWGLLVNSETGHKWAYLLTVKRDTEKNCNQISWNLRS